MIRGYKHRLVQQGGKLDSFAALNANQALLMNAFVTAADV